MIFDRHANSKYKYGRRNFGAKGYFVDTVGRNEKDNKRIYKKSVYAADQISWKEYTDPFMGSTGE